VVIEGERILAVEPVGAYRPAGARVVDVEGYTITPGFIDVHSHSDNAPFLPDPDVSKILQGVTTDVVGNCGMSPAPRGEATRDILDRYLDRLFPPMVWQGLSWRDYWRQAEGGMVTHVAPLVGHGALRVAVMGMDRRLATADEKRAMRALLREALDDGAFGYSTGLIYPPGIFSDTEELTDLARELGPHVYASHIRGEGDHLVEAVAEALAIGREAGVQVEVSHHKAGGRANWGKTRETLALMDAARASGQLVRQDVYPYTAGSTILTACLPPWSQEGGDEALLQRLRDPEARRRMRRDLEADAPDWESELHHAGADGIVLSSTGDGRYEGESLAAIAGRLGVDPIEALFRVLVEERLRATMVVFIMDEGDVQRVLAHPYTMVGSDALPPGRGGKPHPRTWGTFPRILGHYWRTRGLLSLEQAVYKMTGLPAETFHIPDRGRIAPGQVADLVVLDAGTVIDRATFEEPLGLPVGIHRVYLSGRQVVEGSHYIGERNGRLLSPAV
jgi:N-acyl-D-aspartate/D-glutamate deacylase